MLFCMAIILPCDKIIYENCQARSYWPLMSDVHASFCEKSCWKMFEKWFKQKKFRPFISTFRLTWWRHQMETFSALLAICAGNSPVNGEFPTQRPVARSFDVFFDLRPNKRLSIQSWGWWFEALSRPLWRHCNEVRHSICLGWMFYYSYHSGMGGGVTKAPFVNISVSKRFDVEKLFVKFF